MHDLSWTGNHLIDPVALERLAIDALRTVSLSSRGDTYSERLVEVWAREQGVPVKHVAAGAGSTPILDRVVTMLGRNRPVLDVVPNYLQIPITCRREKIDYRPIPVRDQSELLPALQPFLGTKEVVVCMSSPRNPFGYRIGAAALRKLLSVRPTPFVVLDEVYGDVDPTDTAALTADFSNLLLVRSLSKAWALANVRVGFLIWSDLPETFASEQMLRNHLGGLQQAIALGVIKHPEAVRETFSKIRALRAWFSSELTSAGLSVWSSEAGFVCLESEQSEELHRFLAARGIRVALLHDVPGYSPEWPEGLRIAVGPKRVLEEIISVVQLLRAETDVETRQPSRSSQS